MNTKKFTYSIHFGLITFFVIYLLLFDYIPGGETGLIYVTPVWFLPVFFGIFGHVGVRLGKKDPVKYSLLVSAYLLALLALFFKGVWPML